MTSFALRQLKLRQKGRGDARTHYCAVTAPCRGLTFAKIRFGSPAKVQVKISPLTIGSYLKLEYAVLVFIHAKEELGSSFGGKNQIETLTVPAVSYYIVTLFSLGRSNSWVVIGDK